MTTGEAPRVVTLECDSCGEGAVFTDWGDSEDRLDVWIQQELWTVSDAGEWCPECSVDRRGSARRRLGGGWQ